MGRRIRISPTVFKKIEWPFPETSCSLATKLLCWPTRLSFTRQPSVEIHTIGSSAVLNTIVDDLLQYGCRLAEPGEFTMRAFLAGRIDLTQAEAILGVIDARNRREFHNALGQLAGGIGGPIQNIRDELLGILAELEAGLDFVDEDIEFISQATIQEKLSSSHRKLVDLIQQIQNRGSQNNQIQVALVGPPNAGKSSLFNFLSGQNAIVSPQQGTTRDYLSTEIEIAGTKINLIDTAGLIENAASGNHDRVNEKAQIQSINAITQCQIIVWCQPANEPSRTADSIMDHELTSRPTINVATKSDLVSVGSLIHSDIGISTITGQGIDQLRAMIANHSQRVMTTQAEIGGSLIRTFDSLQESKQSILHALEVARSSAGDELVAAEIRLALEHLGRVVGKIYTDDILDVVFSQFCIGK